MDLTPVPSDGFVRRGGLEIMEPLCAVFRQYLRKKNLKYTPERADILDAIIERDAVFEVDALLVDMHDQGFTVSKATVYRTIKLLQEAGTTTQAFFDDRQSHYQLVYGKRPRDYMICMKTGRHVEFVDEELTLIRDRICTEHGWNPVGHRFLIYAISPADEVSRSTTSPSDQT